MNVLKKRYEEQTGRLIIGLAASPNFVDYVKWLERQLTWRPESEKPGKGQIVLVTYKDEDGIRRYSKAEYIRKHQEKANFAYDSKDDCDYIEETGEYFLTEGWYELIENCPDIVLATICGEIDYWLPIPQITFKEER